MKPMIATDTKEPLVVMGGYALAEGGRLMPQTVKPGPKPLPTDRDLALYREHGMAGLEAIGYFGVIDRIKTGQEQGVL
jgi:hypothetical protein